MRRICSHCGIEQSISDEKAAVGWLFVKCHLCGETSALAGRAWQGLARGSVRSKARPETRGEARVEAPAPKLESPQPAVKPELAPAVVVPSSFTIAAPVMSAMPMAFPPIPEFLKPVKLEEKREPYPELKPEAISQVIQARRETPFFRRANMVSITLAVSCIGSGLFLAESVKRFKSENAALLAASASVPADVSSQSSGQSPTQLASQAPAQLPPQSSVNRAPAIVDRIDLPAQAAPAAPERVRVKAPAAVLRSGPGKAYAKLGVARADLELIVKASQRSFVEGDGARPAHEENWLQVETANGLAWIRGDLVAEGEINERR